MESKFYCGDSWPAWASSSLQEWIECEQATIRHTTGSRIGSYGRMEEKRTIPTDPGDLLQTNFQYYFDYLRSEAPRSLIAPCGQRPLRRVL